MTGPSHHRMRRFRGVLAALAWSALALPGAATKLCSDRPYVGFDSRLEATVMGRLPPGSERVTGFVVAKGVPLVAVGDRLFGFSEGTALEVNAGKTIDGLAVDASGKLVAQTGSSLSVVRAQGLEALADGVLGRCVDMGADSILQIVPRNGSTELLISGPGEKVFPLARFEEPVRAVSWGPRGLAVVAGDELLVWKAGAAKMEVLWRDRHLAEARDVCLVGDHEVVVALNKAVIHLSQETTSVISGFSARCASSPSGFYLLDEQTGLVWRIRNLDVLGSRSANDAHAKALLQGISASTEPETRARRFGEAARLLGCSEAMQAMSQARAAGISPTSPGGADPASGVQSSGTTSQSTLGITVVPAWLNDSSLSGVIVRNVVEGSVLARGGLRVGDRIVDVNGISVGSQAGLEAAFLARNLSEVAIVRDGAARTLVIQR